MIQHEHLNVCGLDFNFSIDASTSAPLQVHINKESVANFPDTWLIHFRAHAPAGPFTVHDVSIQWEVPAIDMHGFFAGQPSPEELTKLPFWWIHKQTGASTGFPFISLFHRNGENRFAFGLIDQLTETALDAELSEAKRAYHFHWHKPIGRTRAVALEWQEHLLVSAASLPWHQVFRSYVDAVDRIGAQPKMTVPEFSYDPVFCTWTAVHHDVNQAWVLRNARLAADLGFGTWLTDDGWFTHQATFGDYRYTGDWEPDVSKFPDFVEHVRQVQAMGLRYVLWLAPFMVGDASRAARDYAHLLTEPTHPLRYRNLSPRRAETCEVVSALVERLMREYGLDGLKIDFIDAIALDNLIATDGDYATLGEGVFDTLRCAVERAQSIKPGALIEFRNPYANLASRRYANLYRASDVPLNFAMNRWQVTLLRLLVPDRAVHLDPALWHPNDTDENVAAHLINAICAVPMVSVELDRYPQHHLDLIRYWIGFYRAHRDTLVHSTFAPEIHLGQVPLIRFTGAQERIIGVYDDIAFAPELNTAFVWILNASTRPFVELLPDGAEGKYHIRTRDKFGHVVRENQVVFPVVRLAVEVGGSIEIAVESTI